MLAIRAETEGNQQQLQASVIGDAGDGVLQYLEGSVFSRQAMQEDDVEHDPADGHQTVDGTKHGGIGSHVGRHAEAEDGDKQGGYERQNGRNVGLDMEKSQCGQHDDDRYGRQ